MKEKKIIILTAILNFISASLKLALGILFSFSTLIADSIQSFIDFLTDIISLVANKIGKRRANKTYPFGYGQVYCLSNLFTGALLFLIGLFIVYQIFTFKNKFTPNLVILIVLLLVLILKGFVLSFLNQYAKSTKKELLIESYKESKADFISGVIFVMRCVSIFTNTHLELAIATLFPFSSILNEEERVIYDCGTMNSLSPPVIEGPNHIKLSFIKGNISL